MTIEDDIKMVKELAQGLHYCDSRNPVNLMAGAPYRLARVLEIMLEETEDGCTCSAYMCGPCYDGQLEDRVDSAHWQVEKEMNDAKG